MRSLVQLAWPDTFGQRFKLALVVNLLVVCLVTFMAGLIFGPMFLPATALLVVASVLMAFVAAALARPGQNFWKRL
ncbi:MAG TPA: hypothetical protein GXZ30_06800 [Propionibacterium sp.]|jgi:hypothetical protein|nr:hypothetical protein [Propionibacterium sp.]